jgi:hypothetical protein
LLASYSAEQLADCMTFEEVELRVVQDLKQRIVAGAGANMDVVHALIARRRDGHWANPLLASANERTRALAACYDALSGSGRLLQPQGQPCGGLQLRRRGHGLWPIPRRAVPLRPAVPALSHGRRRGGAHGLGGAA